MAAETGRDRRPRHHPLLAVAAAAALGAAADRMVGVEWRAALAGSAAALAVWSRRRGGWWLLAAVALAAAAGHHARWQLRRSDALHLRLDEQSVPMVLRAIALEGPRALPLSADSRRRDSGQRRWLLRVRIQAMRDHRRWTCASGAGELSFPLPLDAAPHFDAGDRLRVCCEAQRRRPAANPGDWDPRQSSATRQLCLLRSDGPAAIEVERPAPAWSPRRLVASARRRIERQLRRHIASPQAELATALLLGRRELLDEPSRMAFIQSGTAHLLALSGLHVGLLAGLVWLAGRGGWMSRRVTCVAAAATALAYLLLAGPRASLVRAAVLIVAVAWTRWLGRPRATWNTLSLAALLLAAADPTQLFDTGAQLSFVAVAALGRWGGRPRRRPLEDPLARLIDESRGPLFRALRGAGRMLLHGLLVSAAVWIATAPIVAWRFGRLAPIGICLNPLLGPLVAGALYAEVAVVACGWSSWLAGAWGVCGERLLTWTLALARLAAAVPGGHFELAPPPASWAACGCGLCLAWAVAKGGRLPLAVATAAWLTWAAAVQFPARTDGLQCVVLSVGHGTCIILRTPDGETTVYDAGRLGGGHAAARAARQCLRRLRVGRISRLIISHEDADHYNAVPQLLDEFPVDEVWVGPRTLTAASHEPGVRWLAGELRRHGTPVRRIAAGQSFQWGRGVMVEVLHPPLDWDQASADNADSLVLRLRCRGRSLLLTGDVEGRGLQRLLALPRLQSDVLLAPHHGSPRSRPAELARRCGARWLLVSSGDPKTLTQWPKGTVLHTARDGAIRVTFDRLGVTVRSWRSSPWSD